MKELLKGLNEASEQIHAAAIEKGFYDQPRETGTLLMLVVSELSEALEADRKDKYCWAGQAYRRDGFNFAEPYVMEIFEKTTKDTHEDEIADTIIRLLDYAAFKKIDLEWHITQKLKYNATRPRKHGKAY